MTELVKSIHIRRATIADVPEIVRLLADDILGQDRNRIMQRLLRLMRITIII